MLANYTDGCITSVAVLLLAVSSTAFTNTDVYYNISQLMMQLVMHVWCRNAPVYSMCKTVFEPYQLHYTTMQCLIIIIRIIIYI